MSFRVSVFTSPTVAQPKIGVYRLLRRRRLLLAGSEDGGEVSRRRDELQELRRQDSVTREEGERSTLSLLQSAEPS